MHGSLTPSDMLIPALAYPASLATDILRRMTATPEDTPGSATLLVTAAELAAELAGPNPPTVIDARWRLGGPPGIDDYVIGHVPGAAYIDLHHDIAGLPGAEGRHPMPDTVVFQAVMRAAGVRTGHPVVVYDDGDGLPAARTWWSLRYFGHDDVRVLDGGYRAWTEAGLGSTSEVAGTAGDFTASPGHMPLLDAAGAEALARDGGLLLDVRVAERYRGEIEPIDPVAGHIPGAVNAPIANTANADGTYRTPAELRAYFDGLRDEAHSGDVGAYCGSGVTAARGVFALALAGIPAALYVGSWSNWTADPTRPIATS
jgi:thiosulfate/3-mercaptopyruvate sulfurtransferase